MMTAPWHMEIYACLQLQHFFIKKEIVNKQFNGVNEEGKCLSI